MKNSLTKILILVLILSNSYLAYIVLNGQNSVSVTDDGKVIREVVTEYTTDVTEVVDNTIEKVVGVAAMHNGAVYSSGSGAIYDVVDNKILIVTNNHVIEGNTDIEVTFANGEQLKAIILGSDALSDLALLSVEADFSVDAFTLGDSSLVKVGENVLAIGSPLGQEFQGSVTMGIISGKDRVVPVDLNSDGVDDWDSIVLQTDAAINPGNSGGPLINMAGELIGITSMKIADSSVEGMGFAIPINEIVPIITQLYENGEVTRPVIGVSAVALEELTVYQKSYYGIRLDLEQGLYIFNVTSNSPASKAGIREGDILTSFDGEEITSFKAFRKMLYSKSVGDEVVVEYERDGSSYSTSVTLQ